MQQKRTFKSRGILISLIILALLATSCAATNAIGGSGSRQSAAASGDVGVVTQLTSASAVEASGSVAAQQQANLFWKTTGRVDQVLVQPGQVVQAGDVLMTLALNTAPASVISAQADQINAQEMLDNLQNPTAQAIAAAEKLLADAHAGLDQAYSNLKSELSRTRSSGDSSLYEAYEDADAALADAQNSLPLATADAFLQAYYRAALSAEKAYRDYQDAQDASGEFPDSTDLSLAVTQTEVSYEAAQAEKHASAVSLDDEDIERTDDLVLAQADFDAAVEDFLADLEGSNAHQSALALSAARAGYHSAAEVLAQAQLDLYQYLTAADPADVSAAQSRLDAAQATLDTLSIIAPFDGDVLAVHYQAGDMVASDKVAVVLANRNSLQITAQVDESEIAGVNPADKVEIVLDSLPDVTFSGAVDLVNPVGQAVAGVVKYTVEITLDATDVMPLLGATADVTIFTSDPMQSLAVPVSAVQSDVSGEYVSRLLADGSIERVPVVSGSLQGDLVLVQGNLQVGDAVRLNLSSTTSSSSMSIPLLGGR